jgi:hypothetical protein
MQSLSTPQHNIILTQKGSQKTTGLVGTADEIRAKALELGWR